MIDVVVNDKEKYTGAEHWNELSEKKLLKAAKILFTENNEDEMYAKLVCAIFGFSGWFFFRLARTSYQGFVASEVINKLLPEIKWITEKNQLTKQLLPRVAVRSGIDRTVFYAPSSNFENLKMEEFADAEFCFAEYNKEKDINWLWRMMACLYRKGDKTLIVTEGDARYKYNMNGNEHREKLLKQLPKNYAWAFCLWYSGCRAKLIEDFEFVFDAKAEAEAKAENKTQANTATSWVDLIHGMAGEKLGDIDKVKNRLVREVFYELQRLKIQDEELKNKYPELYK